MTKREAIDALAQGAGMTRKKTALVVALFAALVRMETWADGRFSWPGLGVFVVRKVKGRKIALEGKGYKLPALRVVKFRAAKSWRARKWVRP